MINKLIEVLSHPNEMGPLFKLFLRYRSYRPDKRPLEELANIYSDSEFCFAALGKVSRSFSVVIQQLPDELKEAVCIYYLVLRALDSIEDDTASDFSLRKQLLSEFPDFLYLQEKSISGVGDKQDYRILLENFQKIRGHFLKLDVKYQEVIVDSCREMGAGMILYLDRELEDLQHYDAYCYYVAGLVGIGLSRLFVLSGLQDSAIIATPQISVSMGLFLQKTNIIRDFHEDIYQYRTFWPKEIWGKYAKNLTDFIDADNSRSVDCLNDMVADALKHVPDCLKYLSQIQNPAVFQFCAIPQVMAMATLAHVFNNKDVFSKNVKIRKGLTASLIFNSKEYMQVENIFKDKVDQIAAKSPKENKEVHIKVLILQRLLKGDVNEGRYRHDEFLSEDSSESEVFSRVTV